MTRVGPVSLPSKPQSDMKTELLPMQAETIAYAITLLKQGEAVAFPTDTVYGVGVFPYHLQGIDRLYALKEREREKGIPLLLSDSTQLSQVAHAFDELRWRTLFGRFWPGALTVILPRHPDLPQQLSPNANIAVRVPAYPLTQHLLLASGGALAVSSANISGQPPATTAAEAFASLQGRVALVLDGGSAEIGLASTIIDLTTSPPRLLREGSITQQQLNAIEGWYSP